MSASPLVDRLVECCADVLAMPPETIMASREHTRTDNTSAYARAACWQVLRELSWTLERIGEAFGRDHSTVSTMSAKSARLCAVDPAHADLVAALRRVAAVSERGAVDADIERRVRISVWALDQEIAASESLRAELDAKLARARFLRANFGAYLERMQPSTVPTRKRERGVA